MTSILKTQTPQDFLALVPQLVGFTPTDSIVLVAFRGKRSFGALRFSLPDDPVPKVSRRIATTFVGMLSKIPGVTAVVPVVYVDENFDAHGVPPRSEFVDAVITRCRFSGFEIRDALWVAADAWGCYLEDRPVRGRPLDLISASTILDDVPVDDRLDVENLEELSSVVESSPRVRDRVAEEMTALHVAAAGSDAANSAALDRILAACPAPSGTRSAFVELPTAIERVLSLEPAAVSPIVIAFVAYIAQSGSTRDALMMQWAFDEEMGEQVLDDAYDFSRGVSADQLATARIMLGEGERPNPRRILRAIELLRTITGGAPTECRPALLSILAWLNWALGRGSVASRFVEQAQAIDAQYGFGEIMRMLLDTGRLPEWAFDVD